MGHITFDVYLYGDVTGGKDSYRNRETRPYKVTQNNVNARNTITIGSHLCIRMYVMEY
jgi:hypothetical protein